jgi:hypothetical protein
MIEAYIDRSSYNMNDCIKLYVNIDNTQKVNITILTIDGEKINTYGAKAEPQHVPDQSFAEGCDWLETQIIPLTDEKLSQHKNNIFFIEVKKTDGENYYVPFILNNTSKDIAVIANTNTWTAYNDYGGSSFYTTIPPASKYTIKNAYNKVGTVRCSFHKPCKRISNGIRSFLQKKIIGREHLLYGETFLWAYLNKFNYEFDLITDSDVENYSNLKNRKIIMLNCHPEYWTHKMTYMLDRAMRDGVNLIYTGGNAIWRKVLFNNNAIEKLGYPFCGNKLNTYSNNLTIDEFAKDNKLTCQPYNLLGMFYDNRGDNSYNDIKCKNGDHWLMKKAGISTGEIIGVTSQGCKPSGHECDKVAHQYNKHGKTGGDGIARPVLAKGLNKNQDGGEITLFNKYKSKVFSCGSIPFTRCLMDTKVSKMMKIIIDDFLKNV